MPPPTKENINSLQRKINLRARFLISSAKIGWCSKNKRQRQRQWDSERESERERQTERQGDIGSERGREKEAQLSFGIPNASEFSPRICSRSSADLLSHSVMSAADSVSLHNGIMSISSNCRCCSGVSCGRLSSLCTQHGTQTISLVHLTVNLIHLTTWQSIWFTWQPDSQSGSPDNRTVNLIHLTVNLVHLTTWHSIWFTWQIWVTWHSIWFTYDSPPDSLDNPTVNMVWLMITALSSMYDLWLQWWMVWLWLVTTVVNGMADLWLQWWMVWLWLVTTVVNGMAMTCDYSGEWYGYDLWLQWWMVWLWLVTTVVNGMAMTCD